jgi:hypothetical protein
MSTPPVQSPGGDAWQAFCDRLKRVGENVLRGDFAPQPEVRSEGYRHLSRLTVYALQWYLEFHDSEFPAFHRYDDDVVKWGGPNTDNHYYRAAIDPRRSYRIRFDARGVRELIISTPEGEMQFDQYRVFEERDLRDLEIESDGHVEITLGGTRQSGNWIPLHPDTDHVLIRLFVVDWENDAVPAFHIERIGNEGCAPQRPSPEDVAANLDRCANWIERTVEYWRRFLSDRGAAHGDNVLRPPASVPGGAADILYGGGGWNLDADDALLIECEPPDARYWSFQLYSTPWFESLDMANRLVSLNCSQMQIDTDGRFRLVVATRDPGIPNWLDTEGRATGMISYRYIWSNNAPAPFARRIPLADLRSHLPAATPSFDRPARRDQIVRRRAAVARRFRR